MPRRIFTLPLIFLCLHCLGQQNIQFERLSLEQGLSQSSVFSIFQDSKGFMWFGTEDALNRYDGYEFIHYKYDPADTNSLSGGNVKTIIEDSTGIFWIATSGGLNRFDRETGKFTHWKHDKDNPNSLQNGWVLTLFMDKTGVIWVGTGEGMDQFDVKTGTFTHYKNDEKDSTTICQYPVTSILEDKHGNLWVGTYGGLCRLDRESGKFTRFNHDKENPNSITYDYVTSMYEDKYGDLWIGTWKGLDKYDSNTGNFTHWKNDPADARSISGNRIRNIIEDRSGVLWVGTNNNGLNSFDRQSNKFTRYLPVPYDEQSISSPEISSIYEDKTGQLWIGTVMGGVNRMKRQTGKFSHYKNEPNNPNSLPNNTVFKLFEDSYHQLWINTEGEGITKLDRETDIFTHYTDEYPKGGALSSNNIGQVYETSDGTLWILTWNGGLNRYDRERDKFTQYKHNPNDKNSLSSDRTRHIYEDKSGILWIGTWKGGLNKLNNKTGKFSHYLNDSLDQHSISSNKIMHILEDKSGMLWIGTFGGGLNKFNRQTEKFISYQHDSLDENTISSNHVWYILEDHDGNLWLRTKDGGAGKFDRKSEKFKQYKHIPGNPNSLSSNRLFSVYLDDNGTLWIGSHAGLNKYLKDEDRFKYYTEKDGLSNNVVYCILGDKMGNLWLSTNRGISKFNIEAETFRNYTVNDGLQSLEFNANSKFQNKEGEMFFGGINGFNVFHPKDVIDNPSLPDVVISGFQIFNNPVSIYQGTSSEVADNDDPTSIIKIDDKYYLHKDISYTKEITLSYRESVFSFEFVALHYTNSKKNQYAYMMEGFDEDWNYSGTRRFASYTSLAPGTYTFKVKGANSDGVWNNQEASIRIIITPPFWATWWFRISTVVLLLSGLYIGYKVRVKQLKERQRELESQVADRTKELSEKNIELEKLSIVARETDNSIMIANADGDIEWVNDGFTKLSGYTFEEFQKERGNNLAEISSNPKIRDLINTCIKKKESVVYESVNTTKNGDDLWLQTTLTPIIEDGELKKLVAIDSDITERKKAEETISQKNKDITDSITYAKRIQEAIFPLKDDLKEIFPESFILFKPKDIVSGDFYWFSKVGQNGTSEYVVAAADCTGHGVPGAFMSMIGNAFLNEIVNEKGITKPNEILNQLREEIVKSLKQDVTGDSKDGMDMALCTLSIATNGTSKSKLQFCGANNPLYLMRKGVAKTSLVKKKILKPFGDDLGEIKGDRQPVGIDIMGMKPFTNHAIDLQEGDTIYIFSDGYADQFGGPKGKKFMAKQLKQLLLDIQDKDMSEQEMIIDEKIEDWKHGEEQIDDILMIGIRV